MRRVRAIALLALTAAGVLAGVSSAQAAPTDPFQYKYSFDGSSIPGGVENPERVEVDHQTGNVLVYGHGDIHQYDAQGNPVNFPALGSPTLPVGAGGLTFRIDNTGGPTQGNMYLFRPDEMGPYGGHLLWSYAQDGSPLGGVTPHEVGGSSSNYYVQALVVKPNGSLQVFVLDLGPFTMFTTVIDPIGQVLGPTAPFVPSNGSVLGGLSPNGFDQLGNLYAPGSGGIGKYDGSAEFEYLGETGLPEVSQLAVDPSTNDVYARDADRVIGIHYSDPLVASLPFEVLKPVFSGGGPIAFDSTGQTLFVSEGSRISVFERGPATAPFGLNQPGVDQVTTARATLHGQFNAGGAPTSYHFEYGPTTSYGSSTPETSVPFSYFPEERSAQLQGLQPNTVYHARIVATNSIGTTKGPDKTFKTYALSTGGTDPCPNALARKQTAAQSLPDCRAFELVSAADTGGYDVESYLVPGQTPFPGFPLAKDRVLYATHSGAVPGPWRATNKGPDPYLATRGNGSWSTSYLGLPSDLNPLTGSFSSALGEADSGLGTLAFAGQGLCNPCFGAGLETGIPVRLPDGQLVQGMNGSLAASVPASAKPEGRVAKYFSQDGKHLLFASVYAFEPGANTGGDLTVYDSNLSTGTTQIASTDPGGNPLTGSVSELDVSADGSRIVSAKGVSVDGQGNEYAHPYMHIGSSPNSVDLAPGTNSGVLFAGMTEDGTKVFFTTADKLVSSDTDESSDLYEAAVDGSGNLSLKPITQANSDACNPVANSNGAHWNTTGSGADCGAVAISGGGGIASRTGAVYLLSPEQFGGKGTLNQPNLYLAQPGNAPTFVATLEPNNPVVIDSVKAGATRRTGDFQVTPSGGFAAFTSALPLTGVDYFGFRNVFSYDADAGQTPLPLLRHQRHHR